MRRVSWILLMIALLVLAGCAQAETVTNTVTLPAATVTSTITQPAATVTVTQTVTSTTQAATTSTTTQPTSTTTTTQTTKTTTTTTTTTSTTTQPTKTATGQDYYFVGPNYFYTDIIASPDGKLQVTDFGVIVSSQQYQIKATVKNVSASTVSAELKLQFYDAGGVQADTAVKTIENLASGKNQVVLMNLASSALLAKYKVSISTK